MLDEEPLPPGAEQTPSPKRVMSDRHWARRVARERAGREEAERLLEAKSLELFEVNQSLSRKLQQITAIFDGAPYSILTIKKDLTVGARFSSSLPGLLGHRAEEIVGAEAGAFLREAFDLSADAAELCRQTLEISIGEDELSWELNRQHLPSEAVIERGAQRTFELLWTPLIDEEAGVVSAALVSVRDVTQEREMAAQLAAYGQEHERLLAAIDQLMRAPATHLSTFFKEADARIERLDAAAARPEAETDQLMIEAHTLKGAARSLGFGEMVEATHALEDALQSAAGRSKQRQLSRALEAVATAYAPLRRAFYDVMKGEEVGATRISAIAGPHLQAARDALEQEGVESRLLIDDSIGSVRPCVAAALGEALPHLLANMVDHSILPAARAGAIDRATMVIEAGLRRGTDDTLLLTLRDNGRGFDVDAIRRRAEAVGLACDPAAPLAVVFEPGFSTACAVSMRSGRGVGMAAVRQAIEGAGGRISICAPAERGSCIDIHLPLNR